MKYKTILSLALVLTGIPSMLPAEAQSYSRNNINPLLVQTSDPDIVEQQAQALLASMTPEERFGLVHGTGFATLSGIPRIGLPTITLNDAGAGFHAKRHPHVEKTTAFPATLVMTSTWNTELAQAYAKAIGHEFRAAGVPVLLGPGLNLHRVSLNGRNLEYMGEDPFLISRTIEAYIRGAQSTGVAATLKHFAANNHEHERRQVNAIIDDRTLREIYLPGFQAGIDAGAWAVMSAYNLVNGEWAGESYALLTEILRNEMGFRWLTMTDWGAVNNGLRVARSGTDLEMPRGEHLNKYRDELLGSPEIDRMVLSILRTGIASGIYEAMARRKFQRPKLWDLLPEHAALARTVNHEGIVLLKNNGLLPLLDIAPAKILVTGNNAEQEHLVVAGSGYVEGYNLATYAAETRSRFPQAEVVVNIAPDDDMVKAADLVLVFAGFEREGEWGDRPFLLPDDALIARCVALNKNTIVTLTTGGAVGTDWADASAAIVQAGMGGQAAAPSLFDLLTGDENPSGKLPYSFEKRFEDSPAYGYDQIPLTDQGREKTTYDLPYHEGVFVGYRWYDEKEIEPRFPFGHGLTYTTFDYADMSVTRRGDEVQVRFTITNTGDRAGREIAQVYVSDPEATIERPPKELKGYKKVALEPGESQEVSVTLNPRAFSYWCPDARDWVVSKGPFGIHIGASSRDIRLSGQI
jgi:beta-glucosidase